MAPPAEDRSGGVVGWIARGITGAITAFFRGLVSAALNPLLKLLGRTALSTPTLGQVPRVGELWESGRQFTLAAYALLVIIAGITVMAYESVQTRYSIKQIAPRVVVGFLAANLSLLLCGQAITFANAASAAALGDGVDPDSAAGTLTELLATSLLHDRGLFLIFLGLALAGLLVALLVGYVVRVALTVSLIAGAAPALACLATPFTEPVARWWCRAFAGVLAIQVGQSVALAVAVRVFFAPGGWTAFGPNADGLVNLLVTLALVYILLKIPFWVLHAVQVGGGRSLLGTLVRGALTYRLLGLLPGHRGGGGGGGGGGGWQRGGGDRRPPPRPRPGPGGADPYTRPRADRNGQYLLPLQGLRRVPRPKPAPAGNPSTTPPTPGARPAAAGRQLSLPLDGQWPEDRPVLQRDGQYRLPINVTRLRRPTPTPASRPAARSTARLAARGVVGQQLRLPLDGQWPQDRPVLQRDGQYRLPINAARLRRPTPPTAPTAAAGSTGSTGTAGTAARRAARGRQLTLPLDLPTRPRRPAPARRERRPGGGDPR